jgi:serine/threonine protein kinase
VSGRTLKHYLLEEVLGQGGGGAVYRGRDTKLGRPGAVKVLPPECVRDPERRRRFEQEARAAAAISHPAIAQVFDVDQDGDLVHIVMEIVEGSTVRRLAAAGGLDVRTAVGIAVPVAEALARAHEAGIVHRDIKGDNIMVTRDGHSKMLDFGVAKLIPPPGGAGPGEATAAETVARTQAGALVGTLASMSPEQARGLPVDRRSDVFSFGIVLYEMATGGLPFEGATSLDLLHAVAYEEPAAAASVRPEVPHSLERVIERCLRKRPEDRYQDLRDAAADLRAVRREIESGRPAPVTATERLLRRGGGAGGAEVRLPGGGDGARGVPALPVDAPGGGGRARQAGLAARGSQGDRLRGRPDHRRRAPGPEGPAAPGRDPARPPRPRGGAAPPAGRLSPTPPVVPCRDDAAGRSPAARRAREGVRSGELGCR